MAESVVPFIIGTSLRTRLLLPEKSTSYFVGDVIGIPVLV